MSGRSWGHRPVPGSEPYRSVICGHRLANGRYCGWFLTRAINGSHDAYHWRHLPDGPRVGTRDSMPAGWVAYSADARP